MEEFYPYTLTIHLLCAILFIGYLFVDVFVLGVVRGILKRTCNYP